MIIEREILKEATEALNSFPILVITGARQTGKTTLSKLLTDKPYYNLESPDTRELISSDPRSFLNKIMAKGAIIEEFQRLPDLSSYLQEIVDANKQKGMFILTGSNNFLMMSNLSQSLAGRAAILKLPPLTLKEIFTVSTNYSTDELIIRGFYPAIYAEALNPTKVYDYYYQTYVERDVRQLINIKDLHVFQRFVRLCAGRVGQILNYEQFANEVGASSKTIKSWLSLLEASYIVFLLPPYYSNIGKRIVKSSKLYFFDVGLASYLLGITETSHLSNHPLKGALFENMIVSEFYKKHLNQGKNPLMFFYRDNHQNEVDIIIQTGNTIQLVEVKSSSTYHSSFSNSLFWLEKNIKETIAKKILIYDGDKNWENNYLLLTNYRNFFSGR